MIEESFIRLYAHDLVQFAGRAELGQEVDAGVDKRMADARSHAVLMDARKGSDHLASLISRLREEAVQFNGRVMLKGTDPEAAALRRRRFLNRVADRLSRPAEVSAGTASPPMSATTGLTRRAARPTLHVEAAS
jgi:hypothetical protein